MKNMTISLDERVARWARVWAARRDSSVSRLVGEMLRQRMEEESAYAQAMQTFLSRRPLPLKTGGRYPAREDVHER